MTPPRPRRQASRAGFTLLELLLALVIAAALMAVVMPQFAPAIARAQLYSAARDVASALRHARGQAMITGRESAFELDVERRTYRVSTRAKAYRLPSSITVSLYTTLTDTVNEAQGRIRFFPDGSATGGRVTLAGGGQQRVVDVNWLTGAVRIREDVDED